MLYSKGSGKYGWCPGAGSNEVVFIEYIKIIFQAFENQKWGWCEKSCKYEEGTVEYAKNILASRLQVVDQIQSEEVFSK